MTDDKLNEIEALLPCPFCGGAPTLVTGGGTLVRCYDEDCASSPVPFNDFGHKTIAVAAWNRRVPALDAELAAVKAERDAMREALTTIAKMSQRRMLPLTSQINDLATAALTPTPKG